MDSWHSILHTYRVFSEPGDSQPKLNPADRKLERVLGERQIEKSRGRNRRNWYVDQLTQVCFTNTHKQWNVHTGGHILCYWTLRSLAAKTSPETSSILRTIQVHEFAEILTTQWASRNLLPCQLHGHEYYGSSCRLLQLQMTGTTCSTANRPCLWLPN